ncbi:MAG: hypothetical protein K2L15_01115, partial [Eubacteriales bacterium]|nr:hypothetical protein [Eubacteriales bacterium]
MEFLYPKFERHSILKKELLSSIRDYGVEYLKVKYDNYTKGIISGFDLKVVGEDTIKISKGIAKFEEFIYIADEEAKVKFKAENKLVSLKVVLTKDTIVKDYDRYILEYKLDNDLNVYENQLEICRFKLMEGFKLRDKYKSFEDLQTEFDTINYLNATWAGIGKEAINPYILKRFAEEAMENKLEDMEDLVFCYTCLNGNETINIDLVERYIKNRQGLNKGIFTKEEIFKYLVLCLEDIKGKRRAKSDFFDEGNI